MNLQNASVVINCDLPWNPAKLEQRIARAWRKNQTRPVTVVNLVCEDSIEHRMLDTLALKQTLAASVLDRPGEVKEIKLRSGRQAFVERLQQLVTPGGRPGARDSMAGSVAAEKLPSDPGMAFARLAAQRINVAMVRCEERYPSTGDHSVLVVVVEREAAQFRERLAALHSELFGPAKPGSTAPVQLEVVDRATDEAIQRLIAAGLITSSTRACRALSPEGEGEQAAPLSAEELAKAKAHREAATRKLKMCTVLGSSGFEAEARQPLIDGILALGCALAVEGRLPCPGDISEVVNAPLSHRWAEVLPLLKTLIAGSNADSMTLAERLRGMAS